jgi:SNF2 family DNA or RNA helicase
VPIFGNKYLNLYPKQKEIIEKLLLNQYSMLLGSQGVGKTLMLIYLIKIWFTKKLLSKVLIVTRNEVIHKFKSELLRHCEGLSPEDIATGNNEDRDFFKSSAKVFICDYLQLKLYYYYLKPEHSPRGEVQKERRKEGKRKIIRYEDVFSIGSDWGVILDEVQAVKNDTSDIHKILYKNTREAMARIGSSGTPVEDIEDLYNVFKVLDETIIGMSKFSFINTIADVFPGTFRINYYKQEGVAKIWKKVSPYINKITKEDLKGVVPKSETDIFVDFTPEFELSYMSQMSQIKKELNIGYFASHTTVACFIDRIYNMVKKVDDKNPRFECFNRMVLRTVPTEKLVVWEGSPSTIKDLVAYYDKKGIKSIAIWGDTPKEERAGLIQKFDEDPSVRLFFVSYLTNQDAWEIPSRKDVKRAIYYSLPDRAISYDQSSDRLHRINSEEPVHLYRLVLRNSIDEWAVGLLDHKMKLMKGLLDTQDFKNIEQESYMKFFGFKKKKILR